MLELEHFIRGIPKAELHMHIEGSIEPDTMFALAERNGMTLKWASPEALEAAFEFDDLQSFLDIYFEGCKVLVTRQDFYDVTKAYLRKAHEDNVVRAEMFLGPQSFTQRTSIGDIMEGVLSAIDDAKGELGIDGGFIVSTHRHRTEADAFELLESVMPWKDRIVAIGMGGPEVPSPPSKFINFFRECKNRGLRTSIHAGEEGPADYVRQAFDDLKVDRIDHGNACLDDADLTARLAESQITLTVCPVSNLKLKVVDRLEDHPLRRLMDAGLKVTINSDDPPYFKAYVSENYIQCQKALGLSRDDIIQLAKNSLTGSFASPEQIKSYLSRVDNYCCLHAG